MDQFATEGGIVRLEINKLIVMIDASGEDKSPRRHQLIVAYLSACISARSAAASASSRSRPTRTEWRTPSIRPVTLFRIAWSYFPVSGSVLVPQIYSQYRQTSWSSCKTSASSSMPGVCLFRCWTLLVLASRASLFFVRSLGDCAE